MDEPRPNELLPDWIGNLRRDGRWKEGHLATLHARGGEWMALTGDLSLGGVRLAVHGVEPLDGEPIEMEIAFENATVSIRGVVRHVSKTAWGSLVGVQFEETGQTYLARRMLSKDP